MLEPHEMVADPEPTMLLGVIAPQVRPDGMVSARATVPPKPLRLVIVTVAVPVVPTLTWREETEVLLKS